MASPSVWPSRWEHSVGTRNSFFEARFLARRCLCLHFTRYLAAPSPRHKVKMVRYSFLVGLFHPRLHAGLSRRLRSHMSTHAASILFLCRLTNWVRKNSSSVSFFRSRPNHSGSPVSRLHTTVRNLSFFPL